MKTLLIIIVLLFSTAASYAQISVFDLIGEATEEAEGAANEEAAKNEAKAKAKALGDKEAEELINNFFNGFEKFAHESLTGKCLNLMGEYVTLLAYCDKRAKEATDPCEKKDWLGMESMILLAGTSISYCPQEFYYEDRQYYEKDISEYFFGIDLQKPNLEHPISNYFYSYYQMQKKFLAELGVDKYADLTPEEKVIFQSKDDQFHKEFSDNNLAELDPHFSLYMKFFFANIQLDILNYDMIMQYGLFGIRNYVSFVGEIFTPQFQLKKLIEIASMNDQIKCNK
ncbi:hypothetical protein ESY86_15600 [Subsaximicrobium wynnwilliamsii]|uniref:Uncharacterized protein n=1 Tax=Subsaximicrobium wynnwilliamsii TaxID=291179 RepID=A0A5C6ZD20_9FLAO|nr:hypothetical protein [Subsaximicrobium wynnwilliamsii]TXD82092.1 hypothetical protein ESY87_15190 [Subsaximicrobium wynnwilliamsii]TXD87737.1 hypothetical protein ESY86_15600 [Subsaximicrobium wynnwilliamsii]TXE01548.1 hypothetical protein ESY88_15180 [Subsaximicrobium wynnwilliamsii]